MSTLVLRIGTCLALALSLAGCGGGGGSSAPPAPTFTDPVAYSSAATASLPRADEISAVTHHPLAVNGATINYTATVGHLTAHGLTSNAPEASLFYIAYTLDGASAATRPVTFFYNGGPGSSTVWLHLGSYGPKRLVTGDPATTAPTPFPLVDNAESLIDVSDLVFVDAVGTGLSEAIAPNVNQTFWSVDADAAVFRDFVMRYLAANNRASSPKFLFGESYGTTRSAVLANMLESAGISLAGVILQSSALNYNVACGVILPLIVSCAGDLPSYGAIGAWFNLDNPNPAPSALPAFIAQMRTLTADQYDPAVTAFLATGTPPPAALLPQLVSTTGMSLGGWQTHFNMDPDFYQANLIPGTLIGRYDARVSTPLGSPLASEGDPSSTFINASFASAITPYLNATLQYTNPSSYVLVTNAIRTWDFAHDGQTLPDTVPDLAAALAQNPQLKVLSVNGYYDLATPFFQTERDLARLGPTSNVLLRFYPAGHMTYLDDGSRVLEKADLVQFYQSASAAP